MRNSIDVSTYRRIALSTGWEQRYSDKYYTPIRRPGDESNRRGKQAAGGRRADRTHRRIAKKFFKSATKIVGQKKF